MEQSRLQLDPSADWLKQAVESWTREGLVRREQARWILARYGLADAETARSLKQLTFVQILTALGALLVGIGVLILVGTQWEQIPRVARLIMLLVFTAVTYTAGYHLAYVRNTYTGVGKALIFLGSLIWGSSIFLVGQMYHLTDSGGDSAEYFTGLAYWFAGTLPLAYVLRSPLQLALSLTLGSIWVITRWLDQMEYSASAALTLVLLLSVGACLYGIGLVHPGEKDEDTPLGPTYRKFAVAFLTAGLYGLTYAWPWETIRGFTHWYRGNVPIASGQIWIWLAPFLTLAVFTSGWALLSRDRAGTSRSVEAGACLGFAILSTLLAILVASVASTGLSSASCMALMVGFNILLLVVELGFVWIGWQSMQSGLVNWGLAVFMVHLMNRYFDVFGRMLPTGLGLVGAGVLVILGGLFLERQRRRLLRTMPRGEIA